MIARSRYCVWGYAILSIHAVPNWNSVGINPKRQSRVLQCRPHAYSTEHDIIYKAPNNTPSPPITHSFPTASPLSPLSLTSIPKPLRHHHRRHQTPRINRISQPRTHNLHPTSPIRPPHSREIARIFEVDVLG